MADATRSQDPQRLEETIQHLRDNSSKHDEALMGLKPMVAAMSLKYDQLATKLVGPKGG